MALTPGSSTSLTTAQANPLSKKISKILETKFDQNRELLEPLKGLSDFYGANTPAARRNLRSQVERRNVEMNQEFVNMLEGLNRKIDNVYSEVESMNTCVNDMMNRLQVTKSQTRDLINETTKLQNETQKLVLKEKVMSTFLEKFQLTPEEVVALKGSSSTGSRIGLQSSKMSPSPPSTLRLTPDFFAALEKTKKIHSDCKMLLRSNQQKAGLEIMEQMALLEETAYERLYRSLQEEMRGQTGDNPEIRSLICSAMTALHVRPVLFQYVLTEFATARRICVVRGFIQALTRGGPGGTPCPIELHSHDPLRYVGDMLAWVHQSLATEKELTTSLLRDLQDKLGNSTSTPIIQETIASITEGVGRPLQVRVEQVLTTVQDAVSLFKLKNLIHFYLHVVKSIVVSPSTTTETTAVPQSSTGLTSGPGDASSMISSSAPGDNSLVATLSGLHGLADKMFLNALNCQASKLLERVDVPPEDLSPSSTLTRSLGLLRDLLLSHDASIASIEDRKAQFKSITHILVDALMQMVQVAASSLNGEVDTATHMINSFHLIHTTLTVFEFVDDQLEMLQAQIEAHVDTLISAQAGLVLSAVDLNIPYQTVQSRPRGPYPDVPQMQASNLKAAMMKFDSFLASPDSIALSQLSFLTSASVRDSILEKSTSLIHGAYKTLYDAITNPSNGFTEPQGIVPRTPDQVKRLIQ